VRGSHAFFLTIALLALVVAAAAWAARPTVTIAATDQTERGKGTFQSICSKCHGDQGQGDKGPRLIGSPNGLSGYQTARGLFDFASTQMPFDNPGTLKEQEYWDVLAFVLDANTLLPPDTILGPENAADISLTK
jgi:mono/diheme cytochrome c family protein